MKIALVEESGRVAQVVTNTFDVSPSLQWIPCPDEVVAGLWEYKNGLFSEIPRLSGAIIP
jgi:hypothetical protein